MVADEPPKRRSYQNSQRSGQAAATRERILGAAAGIVRDLPDWDWRGLTVRAVARRAGVDESTVYRHFTTERNLRDAVLRRMETESGVELENLRLDNFGEVVGHTFAYLSNFPITRASTSDPTFAALDERRRSALLAALEQAAPGWTADQLQMAAAAVDAYWSVSVFERMINTWDLDAAQATSAVSWVIDLINAAVRAGRGPGRPDALRLRHGRVARSHLHHPARGEAAEAVAVGR
jgi:AcrR family transcriptional regulator